MHRFVPVAVLLLLASTAIAADFYVATNGTDAPDRGGEFTPFRTIGYAVAVSDTTPGRPHTIHLSAGTWTRSDELFPISFPDSTTLSGSGMGATVLDGLGQSGNVLTFAGDTLITVERLTVKGGYSPQGGGIIIGTYADRITLQYVEIKDNVASSIPGKTSSSNGLGGGVLIANATNIILRNSIVRGNVSDFEGGAMAIVNASPLLANLTIIGNSSTYSPDAASVSSTGTGTAVLKNSIVWGNPSLDGLTATISGSVTVSYSVVENTGGVAWTGMGNVWGDPLFTDAAHGDFSVLEGSIAVDAGNLDDEVSDEPTPNGDVVNAGAFGGTSSATISGSNFTLDRNSLYFIGVPVQPSNTNPTSVFGDDFGTPPSDSTWNVFTDFMYSSFSGVTDSAFTLEPGRGYILRQRQTPSFTVNADGHALPQNETFTRSMPDLIAMDFFQTLTFVANPFPYPIHLQHTKIDGQSFLDEGASEWALVLRPNGRYIPTSGVLQPWQGAIIVNGNGEWQVPPDRNLESLYDPLATTDWVLQVAFQTVESADTLVRDDGHLFGLGPDRSDYYDPRDALHFSLFDTVFSAWSVVGISPHSDALYHDFRSNNRSTKPVWTWHVRGDNSLPDSIEVQLSGIDTTEGGEYPDPTVGLYASIGDYRENPETQPQFNLREQFSFRVPFVDNGNGMREAWVTIWADSTDWQWASTPETPGSSLPSRFAIESAYPNPFNPTTTITLALPAQGHLSLRVYDLLGRQVAVLADGERQTGRSRFVFDGRGLASGIYFVRAAGPGGAVDTRKVVLLK
ncbi:MAG: T9SS type A sorting domain-containing protein [bacterium]